MVQKLKTMLLSAAIFSVLSMGSAHSAQSHDLSIAYEIYTGGLHTMSATMNMAMDKDDYAIDMIAKPRGLVGRLLPWKGKYQSHGLVKNGYLQPKQHRKTSSWRDETDLTILQYNSHGTLTKANRIETKDGETVRSYDHVFEKELVSNTVDLMTATVHMLQNVTDGKTCDTSIPVFDGKRRFNMVFTQEGTPVLQSSRLNKYNGASVKCTVEIQPVAGWKKKKRGYLRIQEASRAKGFLPTIWIGQAYEGGPMVPVRMEIRSEYGAILMHFQNAHEKNQATALVK